MPFPCFKHLSRLPRGVLSVWLCAAGLFPAAAAKEDKEKSDWQVADAPWRMKVRAGQEPGMKGAGWRIEVPDFGVCRADMEDVVLLEGIRRETALDVVWHGAGRKSVVLAESLPAEGKEAVLYFGGGKKRAFRRWQAERSLVLETRRMADGMDVASYRGWQEAWRKSPSVDGADFVPTIFHGANPFGASRKFLSRYTGWLKVPERGEVSFYTLSRERSWVMVDGSPLLAWTKTDPPSLDPRQVPVKEVTLRKGFARVEYCHAVGDREDPAMVLGWNRGEDGRLTTVPAAAWVQPGTVEAGPVESRDGLPVPLAAVEPLCYYGYRDAWCVLLRASIEGVPEGWEIEWTWPGGRVAKGAASEGISLDLEAVRVMVRLKGPAGETKGERVAVLPKDFRAASVNNEGERKNLLDKLAAEDPEELPAAWRRAGFLVLRDLGPVGEANRWAEAWLAVAKPEDALRVEARVWVLRALAREGGGKALKALQGLSQGERRSMGAAGDLLELDLRLAGPGDPEVVGLATRLAGDGNRDIARRAKIRLGDYHLLGGRLEEAAGCYREVPGADLAGGRAPLIDRACALEIEEWIKQGARAEARQKLAEWELRRPAAKLESDYLLWSGRVCVMEEDWRQALREFEASLKARPDAPEWLEVRFWQARALHESGRKEEARETWKELVRDYPKHERAEACKQWLAKP